MDLFFYNNLSWTWYLIRRAWWLLHFIRLVNPFRYGALKPTRCVRKPQIQEVYDNLYPSLQFGVSALLDRRPSSSSASATPRRRRRHHAGGLLDLKERRAMPRLPGHLVRRRLGLVVEAVDRLGQHELVQLLQADVCVLHTTTTTLLRAVDHLGRRALDGRSQVFWEAMRGEEEPKLQMWHVLQTHAFTFTSFASVQVVLWQWDVPLQEHFDHWF